MAQFICPSCGSEFFRTSKTGNKMIFKVTSGRKVTYIAPPYGACANQIDLDNICCGACSWQGRLVDLVTDHRD